MRLAEVKLVNSSCFGTLLTGIPTLQLENRQSPANVDFTACVACGFALQALKGAMPPVFAALQAIFPDIATQQTSKTDSLITTAADTEQSVFQPVDDSNKSYSSRISAINFKVSRGTAS